MAQARYTAFTELALFRAECSHKFASAVHTRQVGFGHLTPVGCIERVHLLLAESLTKFEPWLDLLAASRAAGGLPCALQLTTA